MIDEFIPVGKLPPDLLAELLADTPIEDDSVVLGPGPGLDCAVLDLGETMLVLKSDPITFTADDLGWYLVQINANDIATTGATPRWLLVTLLFPENATSEHLVRSTFKQLYDACAENDIALIGGHSEITHAIDRPIAMGTLIGEVNRELLVTPQGAAPGDRLLLTKCVPIEAVAILAREFEERLKGVLSEDEIELGQAYLVDPGISVLLDAQIAVSSGRVNAMHDPTEGGLGAALWELADACGHRIVVDLKLVPVPSLARRICDELGVDPLLAISSGALLLSVPNEDHGRTVAALRAANIPSTIIGRVECGEPGVWELTQTGTQSLDRPLRDEIARLFD
ncbi:MAG: AIR synthase family protein [Chloroflexota bacterium]|nr:MAG: AIR synthase family protein [Chloroflexota bacterium]